MIEGVYDLDSRIAKLDISYSSGDPGIVYNTVSILMDEFVEEYRRIRYGETDKVIKYFEEELKRIGKKLNLEEEDLTKYNVEKRIINYIDETKEIAAISKEYELREQDALFAFNSSKSMLEELEKHMDSNAKQVLKNMEFVDKPGGRPCRVCTHIQFLVDFRVYFYCPSFCDLQDRA